MEITSDVLQLAAVVAAVVGILKGYNIDPKHNHVIALFVAAVFVLVPTVVQEKMILIAVVGLTASGAYHYTKSKKDDAQ